VLWCLKWVERRYLDREHPAELILVFEPGAAIEQRIMPQFAAAGFAMHPCSAAFDDQGKTRALHYEVRWTPRNRCKRHWIWCMSSVDRPGSSGSSGEWSAARDPRTIRIFEELTSGT
jgi:hypothetical protein